MIAPYITEEEKQALKKALERRVKGTVSLLCVISGYITIRIQNPHMYIFGFDLLKSDLKYHSLDFIVEEILYHYRQEILNRYFKESVH
jgi:hypothetical protein